MTIDCSSNWREIGRIAGSCIRPGGPVLTERALEICSLPSGSRVADIGCGAGGTLEHLERNGVYRSVGLDCSEMLLGESFPRLASGRRVRGLAETLPFKKGSFDALFCECVLSILGDGITALREFARVLKEGGFLIVSDVFGRGGPGQGRLEGKPQGFRTKGLLAKEDLLGLLEKLGFSLLLWEEHQRLLREFAARMILAGVRLPDLWGCRQGQEKKKTDPSGISYFLLVARKPEAGTQSITSKGDGTSWTT
jgi:SAM-dependent methyltransferase